MKRYEERKTELDNAIQRLGEVLAKEENDIVIDCTLHRFEFTFELAWKTMKDYLEYTGISESIGSPREIIKTAFQYKIIKDGENWINMMLARNSLSHLYDEKKSREIYIEIKEKYFNLLEELNKKFTEIL
jgi:nucleotidyltransferase substrate binding protein (TIGR01987 family)